MRCRVPGYERTTGAYRGHGLHVHDGDVVGLPTGVVRGDAEHDVLGSMGLEHASLLLHADDRIALFLRVSLVNFEDGVGHVRRRRVANGELGRNAFAQLHRTKIDRHRADLQLLRGIHGSAVMATQWRGHWAGVAAGLQTSEGQVVEGRAGDGAVGRRDRALLIAGERRRPADILDLGDQQVAHVVARGVGHVRLREGELDVVFVGGADNRAPRDGLDHVHVLRLVDEHSALERNASGAGVAADEVALDGLGPENGEHAARTTGVDVEAEHVLVHRVGALEPLGHARRSELAQLGVAALLAFFTLVNIGAVSRRDVGRTGRLLLYLAGLQFVQLFHVLGDLFLLRLASGDLDALQQVRHLDLLLFGEHDGGRLLEPKQQVILAGPGVVVVELDLVQPTLVGRVGHDELAPLGPHAEDGHAKVHRHRAHEEVGRGLHQRLHRNDLIVGRVLNVLDHQLLVERTGDGRLEEEVELFPAVGTDDAHSVGLGDDEVERGNRTALLHAVDERHFGQVVDDERLLRVLRVLEHRAKVDVLLGQLHDGTADVGCHHQIARRDDALGSFRHLAQGRSVVINESNGDGALDLLELALQPAALGGRGAEDRVDHALLFGQQVKRFARKRYQ